MVWKNIFHKGVVRPFETWGNKVVKKKSEAKLGKSSLQGRRSQANFCDPTCHAETSKPQKKKIYFKNNLFQITFSFAYLS